MEHKELNEELSEQLALHAVGALDEDSARKWKAHLATGCIVCHQELAEIESTLALLPCDLPPASPPSHLKDRLFERVRASSAAVDELVRAGLKDVSSLD